MGDVDFTFSINRISILIVLFLSVATATLADEQASQKPEDWDQRLEMLRSVPYLALSETMVDEGDTGVVCYNSEKTYNGYNLYCTPSSGQAFLLDMNGKVVHRWRYWLRGSGGEDHVVMLKNGDLVVVKKHMELLRLNWNSKLIWKKELEAHHDVTPAPDGSFYVIEQEHKVHRGLAVRFDAVVHVTADGEEMDRWSTYDHLAEIKSVFDTSSFLDVVLDKMHARVGRGLSQGSKKSDQAEGESVKGRGGLEYFHLNTINVLPATVLGERDGRFQKGNLLVCFRNVNQIAVLEKDTYRLLWAWGEGDLQWPHHPTMLEGGHILIFDNGVEREYSRVVELDPVAEAIVWEYAANPPKDFYSPTRGSAQRLPNGNTLICESDNGRVFEVTRGGDVVWTWLNPVTAGRRRQTVYRMMRLPPGRVDELLERWWWE